VRPFKSIHIRVFQQPLKAGYRFAIPTHSQRVQISGLRSAGCYAFSTGWRSLPAWNKGRADP
jgi:hypothetical protein